MSTIAVKKVKLGDNADTSKNFLIEVPAVADGTLTIKREDGTNVLSIGANGKAVIPGVVGTVAQVGGVPTGQVVERGSNANGEYVRFADGTQICTKASLSTAGGPTTSIGSIYRDGGTVWTFPAAFAVGAHAWCGGNQSNLRWVSHNSSGISSLTSHNFTVFNPYSEAVAVPLQGLCAIGRWF